MVEATPTGAGPASSVRSACATMRASTPEPLVAAASPWVFALVVAKGAPTLRASVRTSGESGQRRAMVPSAARYSRGTSSEARTTSVSAPGQYATANATA